MSSYTTDQAARVGWNPDLSLMRDIDLSRKPAFFKSLYIFSILNNRTHINYNMDKIILLKKRS
jgi:hypothetical protein